MPAVWEHKSNKVFSYTPLLEAQSWSIRPDSRRHVIAAADLSHPRPARPAFARRVGGSGVPVAPAADAHGMCQPVNLTRRGASEGSRFLVPGKLKLMELPFSFGARRTWRASPCGFAGRKKSRLLGVLDFLNLSARALPLTPRLRLLEQARRQKP